MLRLLLMLVAIEATSANMTCEHARIKCAYRDGCAEALQNYMIGCSSFHGSSAPNFCPETCQLALIALTSTEVGKELMTVSCLFFIFFFTFSLGPPPTVGRREGRALDCAH